MTYDTRAVQAQLNRLGFGPLVEDGLWGPRTSAALIAFKRSVGLRPRDYLGPITWAALMESAAETADGSIAWMAEAQRMLGLHESRDTSKLKAWFDKSVSWIDPREIPWCGAFVATVMRKWAPEITLPENPLGARNWQTFGQECRPQLGAIMPFWRGSKSGWQGHVAFYWGEDATAYHVLGANQSDAVTITRVAKDRLLSPRWPTGEPQPNKTIRLTSSGKPLSTNEA